MHGSAVGLVVPSMDLLADYHPQFALAIDSGVKPRPNLRTVQTVFSSLSLNQPLEASFDQQITGYSVFTGFDYTIDPTNAFTGNILKGLSDYTQGLVSGMTTELLVRSRDSQDYNPIPVQTPIQLVARVLNGSVGTWAMNNPDNIKLRTMLTSAPTGTSGPVTLWCVFAFMVLEAGAEPYLCMKGSDARAELRRRGYRCACPSGSGAAAHAGSP